MPFISELTAMKQMLWDSIVDLQKDLTKRIPLQKGGMTKNQMLYYLVNNSLRLEDLQSELRTENARLHKKIEDLQSLVRHAAEAVHTSQGHAAEAVAKAVHHDDVRFNDIRIKYLMLVPEAVLLDHIKPSVLDNDSSLPSFRITWENVAKRKAILDKLGEMIDDKVPNIGELVKMMNALADIPSLTSTQISKWKELRNEYHRGNDAERRKIEAIFSKV